MSPKKSTSSAGLLRYIKALPDAVIIRRLAKVPPSCRQAVGRILFWDFFGCGTSRKTSLNVSDFWDREYENPPPENADIISALVVFGIPRDAAKKRVLTGDESNFVRNKDEI